MVCVTTRFRLRHWWDILVFRRVYRRMRSDLVAAPELLRHDLLLADVHTVYALSIWKSDRGIVAFSDTKSHIAAARRARRLCSEIWSAYWRIDAVSRSAREWTDTHAWPEGLPENDPLARAVRSAVAAKSREA